MKYICHQFQPEAFMEGHVQVHELLRGLWKQLMIPSLWNAFLQREPVSSPAGCCDRGDFGELLLLTSSVTTLSQAEEGRSLARSSFKSFISWGLEEWAKPEHETSNLLLVSEHSTTYYYVPHNNLPTVVSVEFMFRQKLLQGCGRQLSPSVRDHRITVPMRLPNRHLKNDMGSQ